MRLLSIGRALPNRQIDNHSIFNAPAAFDYEAIAIDPGGVFASIRELLDASAGHATHADVQVVNGAAGDGAPRRRGAAPPSRRARARPRARRARRRLHLPAGADHRAGRLPGGSTATSSCRRRRASPGTPS